tara:strand:- start:208 stop:336 length:129 start_codon:yes stop_codon:yes gene_type:complete
MHQDIWDEHYGDNGADTTAEAASKRTLSWFEAKPLPDNGCIA